MDYAAIMQTMRRLALEAGAAIMRVYERGDFEIRGKHDDSPITEADETADALISEGLAKAFPDLPVVTEEQASTHALTGAPAFFIVDPLDGTKEFVRRGRDFTVNIALVEDGVPTRGVVYAPALGRLWRTRADGGAVEERDGGEVPLSVRRPDNDALLVVASKSHRDAATDAYINRYRVAEFRSAGSSLKFCLVAGGEADLYPRLGRTMEWDTAAGDAILRAAGGRILTFEDHAPFVYGKPGYENPFFIAFAPGVELKAA